MEFHPGLAPLMDRFDGFVLDMWGVIHNGVAPLPGVAEALTKMKQAGKRLVVLSNAPRRAPAVLDRATALGIPTELFDAVVSSGEDAWRHLANRHRQDADPWYRALGKTVWYMGAAKDRGLLEGLDVVEAGSVPEADFILNVGPAPLKESFQDYQKTLEEGLAAALPMICCNPDRIVLVGNQSTDCAGALAEYYEKRGGDVRWHGKPYPSVYRLCAEEMGVEDKTRICAVGDSLATDIAGASQAGFASILVSSGIHREEMLPDACLKETFVGAPAPDPEKVKQLCLKKGITPDFVLPGLLWDS